MNRSIFKAAMLAVILSATAAQADVVTFNFDTLAGGSQANLDPVAQAHGVTFLSGFETDDLDAFGDPIPGQTHIEAYADSDIRVADPAIFSRGTGTTMINTLFDQLLIRFNAPLLIDGFGFSEDASGFGDLFALPILFLDSYGKTLFTAGPYTPNSEGSHRYDYSFAAAGVSQILLSSGSKLYDDISISVRAQAVPEPESWTIMLAGTALAGIAARRKRGAKTSRA